MKSPVIAYLMMAVGAVLALAFAAGPLASSGLLQTLFGSSLLLLAFGAAVRRISAKREALTGSANREVRLALEALESLGQALRQTQADSETIEDMKQLHSRIDESTRPPIRTFLQHRQSLLDAYGFSPFAEVMIRFATVERTINRALSSSADGVGEEARACLKRACHRMDDCLKTCATAEVTGQPI